MISAGGRHSNTVAAIGGEMVRRPGLPGWLSVGCFRSPRAAAPQGPGVAAVRRRGRRWKHGLHRVRAVVLRGPSVNASADVSPADPSAALAGGRPHRSVYCSVPPGAGRQRPRGRPDVCPFARTIAVAARGAARRGRSGCGLAMPFNSHAAHLGCCGAVAFQQ